MKKYLPIVIFVLGLLVVVAAFIFVKGKLGKGSDVEGEENIVELPLDQKPITSLTPSEDGHWLTMDVSKLVVKADTMDYELLYQLPDGRTQGVPGTVKLEGNDIKRELLLGSESSGKFRYDEGVQTGTLTLRFRDSKGKLVAKEGTEFHLQSQTDTLSSVDGKFSYKFNKTPEEGYFVTMETFGLKSVPKFEIESGPYGIFSSITSELPGTVDMEGEKSYLYTDNDWQLLEDNTSEDIGTFVSSR